VTDASPEITVKWDVLFDQWFWIARLGGQRRHGWSPEREDADQEAAEAFGKPRV
jgi:hypothetical protein